MSRPDALTRPAQAWGDFHLLKHHFDWENGELSLHYGFERGPEFVERFKFPLPTEPISPAVRQAAREAMHLLHQIAGVSYYKLGMPLKICSEQPVSADRCDFLENTYRHGLAELRFRNGLDLPLALQWVAPKAKSGIKSSTSSSNPQKLLVAVGGGKDSIVALESLRQNGFKVTLAVVGGAKVIADTAQVSGLPMLSVARQLDPGLAAANQSQGWNDHVPITAINSAALLVLATLHGFDAVVFANERSANEPTLVTETGEPVNHQYSKSLAFEQQLQALCRHEINPDLNYFSVLRPLGELGILQRFSGLRAYHPVFSSCNRNFHRDGSQISGRWCGDCPKCRFAFLGLAVFLKPEALAVIFENQNILDDPSQLDGFRALAALGVNKPFECVGTYRESRAALLALSQQDAWRNTTIVAALAPEVDQQATPKLESLLDASTEHRIPDAVFRKLYAGV